VLLEEPDLAYIDETKDAFNAVGIVSRTTFKATSLFTLNRAEVPNCAFYVQQDGKDFDMPLLMVGTTYLKPEE